MITGSQEYERFLVGLAKPDEAPTALNMRIPSDEKVYEIDWNTRTVQSPPFIGVSGDHRAEYIFFKMDRFFETIDLANTIGMIIFKNAHREEYYQLIPYYDIYTEHGKIFFPWSIQAPASLYKGSVEFSFKFFKVDATEQTLVYELNTTIAKTQVLQGWADEKGVDHSYQMIDTQSLIIDSSIVENLNRIIQAGKYLQLEWIDADDEQQLSILMHRNEGLFDDAIKTD